MLFKMHMRMLVRRPRPCASSRTTTSYASRSWSLRVSASKAPSVAYFEAGDATQAVTEADGVADEVAEGDAGFGGDALGQRDGGDSTRLSADDPRTFARSAGAEEELRELGRLAGSGLGEDDDGVALADALGDGVLGRVNRKASRPDRSLITSSSALRVCSAFHGPPAGRAVRRGSVAECSQIRGSLLCFLVRDDELARLGRDIPVPV